MSGKWGDEPGYDMTDLAVTGWGSRMGWVVRLIEMGTDKPARSVDVLEFGQPRDFGDIASLGLTLAEAKQLGGHVQQAVATAQAHDHAVLRPNCSSCGGRCHIKDWRLHQVATLFGAVEVRLPRFRSTGCGHTETGVSWPSHCRSTPELDQLRAHLCRVAAGVLAHLLPVEAGKNHDTLRSHTLKIGERLRDAAAVRPPAPAPAITLAVDSTFIRSSDGGERHLEVRVDNVDVIRRSTAALRLCRKERHRHGCAGPAEP